MTRAFLIPDVYASRIPGTWLAGKTDRSCVAPVAITAAGSTFGAVNGNLLIKLLTKTDCAAVIKEVPPIFIKTARRVSFEPVGSGKGGFHGLT